MKTMIFFMLHIVMTNLFGQDYIVKPDGTKFDGEIVSISKNILAFKNNEGDLEEYEIDKLHVVHISNPNFKMKDVNLNNTSFEKDDDGIHIMVTRSNTSIIIPAKAINHRLKETRKLHRDQALKVLQKNLK